MSRTRRASALFFRVICLSFSALLIVLALLCRVRVIRTRTRIEELEKALSRAENEQIVYQIQAASRLNLEELERRAVQELGMRKPEPGQIVDLEYPG